MCIPYDEPGGGQTNIGDTGDGMDAHLFVHKLAAVEVTNEDESHHGRCGDTVEVTEFAHGDIELMRGEKNQ